MARYLLENQETERLLFRKVISDDFEAWLPFYEHTLSTKYWKGLPKDPIAACQQQFDRIFERYDNDLGGMNALILKETQELVGICGLLVQKVEGNIDLEIGYSVLPKHWKNGYAFEAAQKCKQYAFEKNLADSLVSIIHIDNLPSQKVARKNGMYIDNTTVYKDNPVHIFRVHKKEG